MFADFMPFKPPALAAHVYFSEFDMLIAKKNWYEQIDESIFHREQVRKPTSAFALAKGWSASLTNFFDTKF